MIKKILFVILLLLISGCTSGNDKYTNVYYKFETDSHYYLVKYGKDNEHINECKVAPSNVYYVFYDYYIYDDDNHIIYNEFYVKGTSYSLFVYKKQ